MPDRTRSDPIRLNSIQLDPIRSNPANEPGGPMRSILLYLLGVPIPIIILIALLYH
jgi:hypothetical protein